MRGWVLSTVVVEGGAYHREIAPVTFPLLAAYAEKWDMLWVPHLVTDAELDEFNRHSPAPQGTGAGYANNRRYRELLNNHAGLVIMDSDTVVVRSDDDICTQVTDEQPIALSPGCNCGTVVMKHHPKPLEFFDIAWARRDHFKRMQWLDQACMMELMGWDPVYPGDGISPRFLGDTEWTPLLATLSHLYNSHPLHPTPPEGFRRTIHPGGVQPFTRRLEMVKEWADQSDLH